MMSTPQPPFDSHETPLAAAWWRLRQHRPAMIGLWLLAIIVLSCVTLPLVPGWIQDPNAQFLQNKLQGPSAAHWLGTDHLGRDTFARLIYGGRISLAVGLVTTAVAISVGTVYGAIAGFSGTRTDSLMMRVVDVLYALPFLVIVILLGSLLQKQTNVWTEAAVMQLAGNQPSREDLQHWRTSIEPLMSLVPLFIAIGALSWLTIARIVRAQVQQISRLEYVEAARSLGLSSWQVLWRHVLPNAWGPVIVYATLTVPSVMLFEAVLSFLGLGVKPPNSSWGILIKEGAEMMLAHPLQLLFPSLIFTITLLALNFVGDGLRDAFDPRGSQH